MSCSCDYSFIPPFPLTKFAESVNSDDYMCSVWQQFSPVIFAAYMFVSIEDHYIGIWVCNLEWTWMLFERAQLGVYLFWFVVVIALWKLQISAHNCCLYNGDSFFNLFPLNSHNCFNFAICSFLAAICASFSKLPSLNSANFYNRDSQVVTRVFRFDRNQFISDSIFSELKEKRFWTVNSKNWWRF